MIPPPDRGQARRWAQEELARPEYARARPGWLQRLVGWLRNHLERISGSTGLGAGQLLALVLFAVAVVVVVVILLRRNVRRGGGPAGRGSAQVLGDTALTGAEHRHRAAAAMADGRYDDAVREWLRAVARRLDERGLLDPQPGRTADELASETARLLPALSGELAWAAAVFDAVSYGSRPAVVSDAERMQGLDSAIETSRPLPTQWPVPAGVR